MHRATANLRRAYQSALAALGVLLPLCMPTPSAAGEVGCGSSHVHFHDPVAPSENNPPQSATKASAPQQWVTQLVSNLREVWKMLQSRAPVRKNGGGCQGPFCSGDAPLPTATPIRTLGDEGRQPDFFLAACDLPLKDGSRRSFDMDAPLRTLICLDAIFHPPRLN